MVLHNTIFPFSQKFIKVVVTYLTYRYLQLCNFAYEQNPTFIELPAA